MSYETVLSQVKSAPEAWIKNALPNFCKNSHVN